MPCMHAFIVLMSIESLVPRPEESEEETPTVRRKRRKRRRSSVAKGKSVGNPRGPGGHRVETRWRTIHQGVSLRFHSST